MRLRAPWKRRKNASSSSCVETRRAVRSTRKSLPHEPKRSPIASDCSRYAHLPADAAHRAQPIDSRRAVGGAERDRLRRVSRDRRPLPRLRPGDRASPPRPPGHRSPRSADARGDRLGTPRGGPDGRARVLLRRGRTRPRDVVHAHVDHGAPLLPSVARGPRGVRLRAARAAALRRARPGRRGVDRLRAAGAARRVGRVMAEYDLVCDTCGEPVPPHDALTPVRGDPAAKREADFAITHVAHAPADRNARREGRWLAWPNGYLTFFAERFERLAAGWRTDPAALESLLHALAPFVLRPDSGAE